MLSERLRTVYAGVLFNTMKKPLITGAWKNLIFINYEVDEKILKPFLPKGTELNLHSHTCYVTLAGFVFTGVRIAGIPIPFHQFIPEINLRFYVKPKNGSQHERGVVFLKEIISKPLMCAAANLFYKEHYAIWPVSKTWEKKKVAYRWHQPAKQKISVQCGGKVFQPEEGSHEEFIMMQYFGYTKINNQKAMRYQVKHPRWNLYPVTQFNVSVNFKHCFGKCFRELNRQTPASMFLAQGSEIEIYRPEVFGNT